MITDPYKAWERTDVFNRVTRVTRAHFNVHPITLATDLHDDLHADSLDAVEFVMALEEEFKAELGNAWLSEDETDRFVTIGDVVACICAKAGIS
jgi:acyl carrier protein